MLIRITESQSCPTCGRSLDPTNGLFLAMADGSIQRTSVEEGGALSEYTHDGYPLDHTQIGDIKCWHCGYKFQRVAPNEGAP